MVMGAYKVLYSTNNNSDDKDEEENDNDEGRRTIMMVVSRGRGRGRSVTDDMIIIVFQLKQGGGYNTSTCGRVVGHVFL